MSMEQFSPGPWREYNATTEPRIISAHFETVAHVGIYVDETRANARLLAASWEMMELLKEFSATHVLSIHALKDLHDKSDALIARVEGREVQK